MRLKFVPAIVASSVSALFFGANAQIFPNDSGVIDVTKLAVDPAIPDDGLDDTAAIQAALNANSGNNRIIYIPAGIYNISDTIFWPEFGNHRRNILQGDGPGVSILKLESSLQSFSDLSQPRAVIVTDGIDLNGQPTQESNGQGFRNSIRGLTIDVGSSNPAAIGISFNGNNQSSLEDIQIISQGPGRTGLRGLDLSSNNQIGPLYIENLEISGFDTGVFDQRDSRNIVVEGLSLENQNELGMFVDDNIWTIRNLSSRNAVPVIESRTNRSSVNIIDANLEGIGNPSAALKTEGLVYLRNVKSNYYTLLLQNESLDANNGDIDGFDADVREYISHAATTAFDSAFLNSSLNLNIKEPPIPPLEADLFRWIGAVPEGDEPSLIEMFGAESGIEVRTTRNRRRDDCARGRFDNAPSIQRAIDASNANTVYFSGGFEYCINSDIVVASDVERLIGLGARFFGEGRFVFQDSPSNKPVIFQQVERPRTADDETIALVHNTSRPVIFKDVAGFDFDVEAGGGDLFINNASTAWPLNLSNSGQAVFLRQYNPELVDSEGVSIENAGADLWVFGMKTEKEGTKSLTRDFGRTELIGGHILSTNPNSGQPDPLFRVENAQATFVGVRNPENNVTGDPDRDIPPDDNYEVHIIETRGDASATVRRTEVPLGFLIPLLSASDGQIAAWNFEGDTAANYSDLDLVTENTSFVPGADGSALRLNRRATASGTLAIGEALPAFSSFSITGWVRVDPLSGAPGLLGFRSGDNDDYRNGGFQIQFSRGGLVFEAQDIAPRPRQHTPAIDDGLWHHFAVTVRAGDRLDYYIDGELVPDISVEDLDEHTFDSVDTIQFGDRFINGELRRGLKGELDQVRLYRRALAATEIRDEYDRILGDDD